MELVICKKCSVRNYIPLDREYILKNRKFFNAFKSLKEVDDFIYLNKDVDFSSYGKKYAAIANDEGIIGELFLDIKETSIVFDYFLYDEFAKPIIAVDMLVCVIRQLHKTFKYNEVISYVLKDNYSARQILETLSFERIHFNKENNLYTYRLYRSNISK